MAKYILVLGLLLPLQILAKVHTFAVIGDAGHWNENAKLVRDSILKSRVKRLILPGDNLYFLEYGYDDIWKNWSSKGLEFSVVAIGNHHASYEEEMAYFKMPGEFYEKKFGKVSFLVLNSDNFSNVDKQMKWLRKKLEQKERKNSVNFVVFHHPPATISRRHTWRERKEFQLKIKDLLFKNHEKIEAILVGHDHQASLFTFGKIPVIVSGAVFESIPGVKVNKVLEDGSKVKTKWLYQSGQYWARLDIDDEKRETWVNFVRADKDEVSCSIRIKKSGPLLMRDNCSRKSKAGVLQKIQKKGLNGKIPRFGHK